MANPFKVQDRWIGSNHPTYFIADIGANHDGDLGRARELIHMAAEAGADAAKFQHFQASKIVSDYGFRVLGGGSRIRPSGKSLFFRFIRTPKFPTIGRRSLRLPVTSPASTSSPHHTTSMRLTCSIALGSQLTRSAPVTSHGRVCSTALVVPASRYSSPVAPPSWPM